MEENRVNQNLTNSTKKSIMKYTASVSFLIVFFRKTWKTVRKALTDWSSFQSSLNKSPLRAPKPSGRRSNFMEQFMSQTANKRGRFAAALATLATAFLLVACGGGGGGGSSGGGGSTPDTTPPVLTLATSSPATTTTTIVFTSDEDLSGTVSVTVKNGTATVAGATALGAAGRSIVWTPSASLAFSTSYSVSASASDLSGNVGTATGVVMTVADPTAWWPPATITPVGVKVFGAAQIPAGCTSWFQQCWKDLVKSGGMKFIETPAVMTGVNSRPIVFAFYQNASGIWKVLPMYRDTGELVSSDISSGVSIEIDWAQGTTLGGAFHEKTSGDCYETTWFPPTTTPGVRSAEWANTKVTCP
jgi:hypothetical protein